MGGESTGVTEREGEEVEFKVDGSSERTFVGEEGVRTLPLIPGLTNAGLLSKMRRTERM